MNDLSMATEQLKLLTEQVELQRFSNEVAFFQCIGSWVLLLVTVISVICAYLAYKHQKRRAAKDAACSLGKFYANTIIPEMEFIANVLVNSGYAERIKQACPYDKLSAFDMKEAAAIIAGGEETLKQLLSDLHTIDSEIIYDARIHAAINIEERNSIAKEYIVGKEDEETGEVNYTIVYPKLLQWELRKAIANLLNNLEWFAMNFQYNLADEEVLYQSLHETFLSCIWSLYVYISSNNRPGADKYFTNVIWLFNLWKNRLRDIQKKAMKSKLKHEQEFKRLKADRDAMNRRYEEAEAKRQIPEESLPTYTGKPL